jgi:hypothetical protein
MTVCVQPTDTERVCTIPSAAKVEEAAGQLIIKNNEDKVIGKFYLAKITGWWSE